MTFRLCLLSFANLATSTEITNIPCVVEYPALGASLAFLDASTCFMCVCYRSGFTSPNALASDTPSFGDGDGDYILDEDFLMDADEKMAPFSRCDAMPFDITHDPFGFWVDIALPNCINDSQCLPHAFSSDARIPFLHLWDLTIFRFRTFMM